MLVDDVKASERDSMRKYYLGDFPPETYADTFLVTSRQMIAAGQQRHQIEAELTVDQGGEDD